jgi:hypothetical protein
MSFWDGYRQSLKPLEVEEPIDVWVHRPLAYLLARAVYPTFITPNMVTVGSILFGILSAVCMFVEFPHHLQAAGCSIFLSAVFDCADGQLARMRGTSSALGRMLDGIADLVGSTAAVGGGTYLVWQALHQPVWLGVLALVLCLATIVTGSFHTVSYDHYKNVFLRLTHPSYREGEDYEVALERYRATRQTASLWVRLTWPVYFFYMKSQSDFVRSFDPYTPTALSKLPPYSPEVAAIYRAHAGPSMRILRSFFGFGSLVFGMAVSIGLGFVQYYMLFRLVVLNAVFYGYLRPRQRRASKAALDELARLG